MIFVCWSFRVPRRAVLCRAMLHPSSLCLNVPLGACPHAARLEHSNIRPCARLLCSSGPLRSYTLLPTNLNLFTPDNTGVENAAAASASAANNNNISNNGDGSGSFPASSAGASSSSSSASASASAGSSASASPVWPHVYLAFTCGGDCPPITRVALRQQEEQHSGTAPAAAAAASTSRSGSSSRSGGDSEAPLSFSIYDAAGRVVRVALALERGRGSPISPGALEVYRAPRVPSRYTAFDLVPLAQVTPAQTLALEHGAGAAGGAAESKSSPSSSSSSSSSLTAAELHALASFKPWSATAGGLGNGLLFFSHDAETEAAAAAAAASAGASGSGSGEKDSKTASGASTDIRSDPSYSHPLGSGAGLLAASPLASANAPANFHLLSKQGRLLLSPSL